MRKRVIGRRTGVVCERGDDVRTLMPGIALAETPEDVDRDRVSAFIVRAVAGRVRVAYGRQSHYHEDWHA